MKLKEAIKQLSSVLACEPMYGVVALVSGGSELIASSRANHSGISWTFELDESLPEFSAAIDRINIQSAASLSIKSISREKDTLEFIGEISVENDTIPIKKVFPCCPDDLCEKTLKVREMYCNRFYETVTESSEPIFIFNKDNIAGIGCVAKCGDRIVFDGGYASFSGSKAVSVADLNTCADYFVFGSSALKQIEKLVSMYGKAELFGNPNDIMFAKSSGMLLFIGGINTAVKAPDYVQTMLNAEQRGKYSLSAEACKHMVSVFRSGGKQSALATMSFYPDSLSVICGDTFDFVPVSVTTQYENSYFLSVEKMYSMFEALPKGSAVEITVCAYENSDFIIIRSGSVWHFTRLMGVTK